MSKVVKATAGLMIATLIAKILGFGRELALATAYGASNYSDAFLVALNIPTSLFAIIGTTLTTAFIPLYFSIKKDEGETLALRFTNNILNIVIILSMALSVLGLIFTDELVKLFAYGFEADTFNMAVHYTRIMLFGFVFLGINHMMASYLQVKDSFIVAGLMSVPYNIFIIAFIFISSKVDPSLLGWGALLGLSSQVLLLAPFAIKHGFKYKFTLDIKDKYIKQALWLIGPVLIGVAVNQVNTIVDRNLASSLAEGSISALNYSNKLIQFILGMFIASVGTVIYPLLSKLSSDDNKENFNKTIVTSVNTLILLIIPITAGAMALSEPIVKLLFERGAFNPEATKMTASALSFYALGIIGFGLRDILGKVFYSLQDTKTPMVNGVICMILNIVLNIILVKYMGHSGLALATSFSAIVCIVLLFRSLKKKIGNFGGNKIIKALTTSILTSVVMVVIVVFAHTKVSTIVGTESIGQVISLGVAVCLGAVVYLAGMITFKLEEIDLIREKLKKLIKR